MDLFPLSAERPFQTPNPRVYITSDKAELPRGGEGMVGEGERREEEGKGGEQKGSSPLPCLRTPHTPPPP